MKLYMAKCVNGQRRKYSNSNVIGGSLINKLIDKVPVELHLPTYQFCGPGTHLEKRLKRGDLGIDELDKACREHDISYSKYSDSEKRNEADNILIRKAAERLKSKHSNLKEKIAAFIVFLLMKAKTKIGMGTKRRKTSMRKRKSRILVAPKRGGFLPILLPLLGALGALGGGAASIATAVNKARSDKSMLEETQRHNRAMELVKGKSSSTGKGLNRRKPSEKTKLVTRKKSKGKGLYIGPYQWSQKKFQ